MESKISAQVYQEALEQNSKLHSELQRLKWLIEEAYETGCKDGVDNQYEEKTKTFEQFKQKHGL